MRMDSSIQPCRGLPLPGHSRFVAVDPRWPGKGEEVNEATVELERAASNLRGVDAQFLAESHGRKAITRHA